MDEELGKILDDNYLKEKLKIRRARHAEMMKQTKAVYYYYVGGILRTIVISDDKTYRDVRKYLYKADEKKCPMIDRYDEGAFEEYGDRLKDDRNCIVAYAEESITTNLWKNVFNHFGDYPVGQFRDSFDDEGLVDILLAAELQLILRPSRGRY